MGVFEGSGERGTPHAEPPNWVSVGFHIWKSTTENKHKWNVWKWLQISMVGPVLLGCFVLRRSIFSVHMAMKQHCLNGSWYAMLTRCGGLKDYNNLVLFKPSQLLQYSTKESKPFCRENEYSESRQARTIPRNVHSSRKEMQRIWDTFS